MGHVATVETMPVDPRPFVAEDEAGIQHQARCTECDWVGPVHPATEEGGSEHAARADAELHEQET
ncbi:MAG: hypothetical protein M3P04_11480 [Actinomycetota bacterium]|nr:hypothetical protein [Actinomycetota bacterium]